MNILTKHKKNALQGFQKFIYNLETMSFNKQKDVIEMAFLEDPIYAGHAIQNLMSLDYLAKLDSKDILKIYQTLPQPLEMFLYAFHSTGQESLIMDKLPPNIAKQYQENKNLSGNKITKNQQESAQFAIIKMARALERQGEITPFPWELPHETILTGQHFGPLKDGEFLLKYEDNALALQGQFKKKQRDGIWKHYYPNGKLMAEGSYYNGEKVGEWQFFYPNGTIKAEGEYTDDLKSGDWFLHDKDGKITIVIFERGQSPGETNGR